MAFLLGMLKDRLHYRCARNLCHLCKNESIRDLLVNKPINSVVNIKGWVTARREKKNFTFINVNDGSCSSSIQIVLPNANCKHKLSIGCCVCISGILNVDFRGNPEVRSENVDFLSSCEINEHFSLKKERKALKKMQNRYGMLSRQYLHYRPKIISFSTILRLRYAIELAVHSYFRDRNFIGVHTPVLTSSDCEGAGETFSVTPSNKCFLEEKSKEGLTWDEYYFNKKAYLTVSGQFHLEALTRGLSKVYTLNHAFRANSSKTRFHLAEFYMVEVEEAFITDLIDIIKTMEKLVKNLIVHVIENHKDDLIYILEENGSDVENHLELLNRITTESFVIMNYSEAKNIIKLNRNKMKFLKSCDKGFTKEEELFLVGEKNNIPIFIINWPKFLKPFYVKASNENADEVQAVDLLVPVVGELCGGSLREDNYELLKEKLIESDSLKSLDWYLKLRKFGNVQTGGFGMGFDRFIQFVLNIDNIKDVNPFPRWPGNLQL